MSTPAYILEREVDGTVGNFLSTVSPIHLPALTRTIRALFRDSVAEEVAPEVEVIRRQAEDFDIEVRWRYGSSVYALRINVSMRRNVVVRCTDRTNTPVIALLQLLHLQLESGSRSRCARLLADACLRCLI